MDSDLIPLGYLRSVATIELLKWRETIHFEQGIALVMLQTLGPDVIVIPEYCSREISRKKGSLEIVI